MSADYDLELLHYADGLWRGVLLREGEAYAMTDLHSTQRAAQDELISLIPPDVSFKMRKVPVESEPLPR